MARRSAKPKQPLSATEILATESADEGLDENGEIATETNDAEQARTGQAQASEPRFHIFVIDSAWNSVASKTLHENLDLIRDLNATTGCISSTARRRSRCSASTLGRSVAIRLLACTTCARSTGIGSAMRTAFACTLGFCRTKKRYCRPFRYSRVS